MKREARDRREHMPPPVQRIELDQRFPRLRLCLVILALALLAGAILFVLHTQLSADAGWTEVEADGGQGLTCAGNFILTMNLTGDATARRKLAVNVYTQACRDAYVRYSLRPDTESMNLGAVNASPNRVLTVDPGLYAAFETMTGAGRLLYLGPVLDLYRSLLYSQSDSEASAVDPGTDPDSAAYLKEAMDLISSPDAVSLELMGENRVCLHVSDAFLAFAGENGITSYLDFGFLTSAFQADDLASALVSAGLTDAVLSSKDGFTRNLQADGSVSGTLYDMASGSPRMLARLSVQGPCSLVRLRSFPASEDPEGLYYTYADGTVRTLYLSPESGTDACAVPSLVAADRDLTCAQLALSVYPFFQYGTPFSSSLSLIYVRDGAVHLHGEGIGVTMLQDAQVIRE